MGGALGTLREAGPKKRYERDEKKGKRDPGEGVGLPRGKISLEKA